MEGKQLVGSSIENITDSIHEERPSTSSAGRGTYDGSSRKKAVHMISAVTTQPRRL